MLDSIGREYLAAPIVSGIAADLWREFATVNTARADRIGRRIDVRLTDNPNPYADASAMSDDVRHGRFIVSNANSDHPVWTVAQNVAYRIAHDVLGHVATGAGFDVAGELLAARTLMLGLPTHLHACEFVETIGQLAAGQILGTFADQRVYIPSIIRSI